MFDLTSPDSWQQIAVPCPSIEKSEAAKKKPYKTISWLSDVGKGIQWYTRFKKKKTLWTKFSSIQCTTDYPATDMKT